MSRRTITLFQQSYKGGLSRCRKIKHRAANKLEDWSRVRVAAVVTAEGGKTIQAGYFDLHKELYDHYLYVFKKKEVEWLN
jgi:hypothetical protein